MSCCCRHSDEEHAMVTICNEQIHYPSEDYPCLCEDLKMRDGEAACVTCAHPTSSHGLAQRCRPKAGDGCACVG